MVADFTVPLPPSLAAFFTRLYIRPSGANAKRSAATADRPRNDDGILLKVDEPVRGQLVPGLDKPASPGREARATLSSTNAGAAARGVHYALTIGL